MVGRYLRYDRFQVRGRGEEDGAHFARFHSFVNRNRNRMVRLIFLRYFNCLVEANSVNQDLGRACRFYYELGRETVVVRVNRRDPRVCLRCYFICFRLRPIEGGVGVRYAKAFGRCRLVVRVLGRVQLRRLFHDVRRMLLCLGANDAKGCLQSRACCFIGTAALCRLNCLAVGDHNALSNLWCVQRSRYAFRPFSFCFETPCRGIGDGVGQYRVKVVAVVSGCASVFSFLRFGARNREFRPRRSFYSLVNERRRVGANDGTVR